ncbi:SH3 domain-containing protein [Saccharothrix sp. AJ9571]|nr:SH3 domain-containing protein [Saccharothrix sp. AJ9571]
MFVALRLGSLVRAAAVAVLLVGFLVLLLFLPQSTESASGVPAPSGPVNEKALPSIAFSLSGAGGLNVRDCPGPACAKVGLVRSGGHFTVHCWISGATVEGNDLWLRGTFDGKAGFASAHFLDGPGFTATRDLLPGCTASAEPPETLAAG